MILLHIVHCILFLFLIQKGDFKKPVAGLWFDDGNGHTVKLDIHPRDAKGVKAYMLDILGLDLPKQRRIHQDRSEESAVNYLTNIHDSLDEMGMATDYHDRIYHDIIGSATNIIGFVDKVSPMQKSFKSTRQLYFDLSRVPLTYYLIGAELRVHRKKVKKPKYKDIVLHIYRDDTEIMNEELVTETQLPEEGWFSMVVTEEVQHIRTSREKGVALRMAATSIHYKYEIALHEIGITGVHGQPELRPFLVGYFARLESKGARAGTIRSVNPQPDFENIYLNPAGTSEFSEDSETTPANTCQKRALYASFKDLGWDQWIIAPKGCNLNFCNGRCLHTCLSDVNATNHVIIQTLIKVKNAVSDGDRLPPDGTCAPKELSTMSVLYYDQSLNIILKKYSDMIVKTCGCF